MSTPQLRSENTDAAPARHGRAGDGATHLAERALLHALRTQPDHIPDVASWLAAADFADPQHGALYATLIGLYREGAFQQVSDTDARGTPRNSHPTAAVHNEFTMRAALADGRFADTANTDYRQLLFDLNSFTVAGTHGQHTRYARMVLESSVRRQLVTWAMNLDAVAATAAQTPAPATTQNDVTGLQQRLARSQHGLAPPPPLTLTAIAPTAPAAPLQAPAPRLVRRAEEQVIGIVLSTRTHPELIERLDPDDFTANLAHAQTWQAIRAVSGRGEPLDPITVAWELAKTPADEPPAGLEPETLAALAASAPPEPTRPLATITRASVAARAAQARHAAQDAAADRTQDTAAVLDAVRQIAGDLDQHTVRLTAAGNAHRPSAITRTLDGTNDPAARPAPPPTPQPGRRRA